jgi:hypothetical protein
MGAVNWGWTCAEDKKGSAQGKEVHKEQKWKLQSARDGDTAAVVLIEKTCYCEAALQQDNSKRPGENELLSCAEITRLDARERSDDNATAQMIVVVEPFGNTSVE